LKLVEPAPLADGAAFAEARPGERGGITIELTRNGGHVGFAKLNCADAIKLALLTLQLVTLLDDLTSEERAHLRRLGSVDERVSAAG
jgi:hypothetical protein